MNPPCIRRWYTVMPSCSCPPCHADRLKAAKRLRVTGQTTYRYSDDAWAALDRMLDAGRTLSDIAATAGIDKAALSMTISRRRQGHVARISQGRALRLIAAETKPAAGGRVDATGTRRRIQALSRSGHPLTALAAATGIKDATLRAIRDHVVTTTDAAYAKAVAAAYPDFENTPGSSVQTQRHAIQRGWAPPAAWDNVDDPGERPKGVLSNAA